MAVDPTAPTSPATPVATSPPGRRRQALVLAAMAAAGLLAGVGAKRVDVIVVPDWVDDLGNYPTVFLLAVVLIVVTAPSPAAAALRAAVAFAAMCLAYYVTSAVTAGFLNREAALTWTVTCVTLVPAGAAMLRWATRRRGLLAGTGYASVAALLTTDGVLHQMLWSLTWADGPEADLWFRPVLALVQVTGLVLLLLVLPPGRRSRLWALALFVPLTFLARTAVLWMYSLVPGLG
ncbi:DUF6518 family protein [Pseudokineococcus sp. 1T1Z-3]|uniref:DUF6518 family protein n=1 Tax=Pseudokineococcus sp. 1T1Z-3 TaxID=3132745 RepID=UPI0030A53077